MISAEVGQDIFVTTLAMRALLPYTKNRHQFRIKWYEIILCEKLRISLGTEHLNLEWVSTGTKTSILMWNIYCILHYKINIV